MKKTKKNYIVNSVNINISSWYHKKNIYNSAMYNEKKKKKILIKIRY